MIPADEREAAERERVAHYVKLTMKVFGALVAGICLVIWAMGLIMPRLNLYRAETERRAVIAEQRAESEAAEFRAQREVTIAEAEAERDVIRARGIAEANEVIAASLTPEYIRWLFVDRLDDIDGQIIYVPTEAGVPITEAGRAVGAGG